MRIFLFLGFFLVSTLTHAAPDWEEWDRKMWLVHTTPIMLENSTAVAGALNIRNPQQLITPAEQNLHHRMTFHSCLGGISPDSTMVCSSSFLGTNTSTALSESMTMKNREYVYMAPWNCFEGEIVGGNVLDTFIFGNHTYGPDSIVFVPEEKREAFEAANPAFEGTPVFYDPNTQQIAHLVREQLGQREAWSLDFEGDARHPDAQVNINGEICDREQLQAVFRSKVSYTGLHSHTQFKIQETLLEKFTWPFLHIATGRDKLDHTFIPAPHDQILHALAGLIFDEIEATLSTLSPECHAAFQVWKTNTNAWLDLHRKLKHSLDAGTVIEGSDVLQRFPSLRNNEDGLHELLNSCRTVEEGSRYSCSDEFSSFVPCYFAEFPYLPAETLKRILKALEENADLEASGPFLSAMKAHLAVTRILRDRHDPTEDTEMYVKLLEGGFPCMQSLGYGATSHFDRLVYEPFLADEADEALLLRTFSQPNMRQFLSQVYSAPGLAAKEAIVLQDLLPYTLPTKGLYSDKSAEQSQHSLFLRARFLEAEATSFRKAYSWGMEFTGITRDLMSANLGKTQGVDPENSAKPMTMMILSNDYKETRGYKLLRKGALGSLDEIFAFYGLEKEFRATYPTDEDLWTSQKRITLPLLLNRLQIMKENNHMTS